MRVSFPWDRVIVSDARREILKLYACSVCLRELTFTVQPRASGNEIICIDTFGSFASFSTYHANVIIARLMIFPVTHLPLSIFRPVYRKLI